MLEAKKFDKLLNELQFTMMNRVLEHFGQDKGRVKVDAVKKLTEFIKKADQKLMLELYYYLDSQGALDNIMDKNLTKVMTRNEVMIAIKYLLRNNFCNISDLIDDYEGNESNSEIVAKIDKTLGEHDLELLREFLEDYDYYRSSFTISDDTRIKAFNIFMVGEKNYIQKLNVENSSDSSSHNFTTNYNSDLLNINQMPYEVIERLKKVISYLQNPKNKEFNSYGLLFEGPSGVGKTEFAKYLAFVLGLPLALRSYGSFSSGFNGETESRINKFFSSAKSENAIVFIDEADSMLFNRENATQDFQISIVNEMLVQIENYPGIVICSTNLVNVLDKAVIRRFAEKIRFNYLTSAQASSAFEIFFKNSLSETEKNKIKKIDDLSVGDFKVVRQKTFFEESVSNSALIKYLSDEVEYRNRLQ